MVERSLFWNGEVLGDCGPYDQSHLMDRLFRTLLSGTGDRGVLRNWLDELEVTGATSPLTVASGGAVVYGGFFQSDGPVSVTIPTPASGTRTDLVVVRRNWAAQTCRIARVAGPGAALTQTPLVTYEVPLASVLANSDGNLTLTDIRDWVSYSTDWPDNAVDTEHYDEGAITPLLVANRYRSQLKDSGSIEPDSGTPCTWVAGAAYDYWRFADAATNSGWVYFMVPTGLATLGVSFYLWTVPDVNGAGGGAENAQWDYQVYMGASGSALTNYNGTVNVDQQARVNTTVYRDVLVSIGAPLPQIGDIVLVQVNRNGAADSYNSAMRLIGVEMYWYADA